MPRLLTPRRIFMRPWRQKLGAPLLVGSTVGTLLITYFGSGVCARYLGLIPGMIAQAEIKIGRRRVIEYIVHPLIKMFDEAAREP